jgi:hypothetical protein
VVEALAARGNTIYFTGRTTGYLQNCTNCTNAGNYDAFVGAVGINGSAFWDLVQFGSITPQRPHRISVVSDDEIYISGYDDIYSPGGSVLAWEDPFNVRLLRNPSTHKLESNWQQWFGTAWADVEPGMAYEAADIGAAMYIAGGNVSGPQPGIFVRKLSPDNGSLLWSRRESAIGYDMAQAVELFDDGVLYAGTTTGIMGTPYGGQDIVIRKLNKDSGDPMWTVQYGSSGTDWVTDMTVDGNGNIYVVGETDSSMEGFSNAGDNDVFLVKFDRNGTRLYTYQRGTIGDDHPSTVAVDACGNIFIGGYSTGNLVGTNRGARDGFVLRIPQPNPGL